MNKAQQKIIINNINVEIMRIRAQELSMQTNFLSNFGTQSAAMVGFVAAALSEIEAYENFSHSPRIFILLYWYASALTMASGIFSLCSSVMIDVYGTNLALRGPEGSLVKAVEDLAIEQKFMFRAFLLTTFFFTLHFIGMCFALFKTHIGYISMCVIFVAMYLWRKYSMKIYHRFCWTDDKIAQLLRTESIADPIDMYNKKYPHLAQFHMNHLNESNTKISSSSTSLSSPSSISPLSSPLSSNIINERKERILACREYKRNELKKKYNKKNSINKINKIIYNDIPSDIEDDKLYKLPYDITLYNTQLNNNRNYSIDINNNNNNNNNKLNLSYQNNIQILDNNKNYKTIYGVLKLSYLTLYSSEKKFLFTETPETLYKRPIDLTMMTLVVPSSSSSSSSLSLSSSSSTITNTTTTGNGGDGGGNTTSNDQEHLSTSTTLYPIQFVPIEKDDTRSPWKFNCLTQQDHEEWIHAITSTLIYYHGTVPLPHSK